MLTADQVVRSRRSQSAYGIMALVNLGTVDLRNFSPATPNPGSPNTSGPEVAVESEKKKTGDG